MGSEMRLAEAFAEIAELAQALGVKDINKLPGCWEHQVDAQWWLALNGHREEVKCSKGMTVPPFTAVLEYNDWPAGVVDPAGGVIAMIGDASEATLIDALKAAAAKARAE